MTLAQMSAPSSPLSSLPRVPEGAGRGCHMRDAALLRYHRLAKTPAEEGGKWFTGLQNVPGAGDSLRGFPQPGQLFLALTTLWPCHSTDSGVLHSI